MKFIDYLKEAILPKDSDGDIDWKKVKKGTKLTLKKGSGFHYGSAQQSFERVNKDTPVEFVKFLNFSGKGIQLTSKEYKLMTTDPQLVK